MGCLYLAGGGMLMIAASMLNSDGLGLALVIWFLFCALMQFRLRRCTSCSSRTLFISARNSGARRTGVKCLNCGALLVDQMVEAEVHDSKPNSKRDQGEFREP